MPWQLGDRIWVSGTPKPRDLELSGATSVITVCRKIPDRGAWPSTINTWQYRPIQDGKFLQPSLYRQARNIVLEEHRAGETVLINCLQGRNRSVLVAILALRRLTGQSSAELIAHAREVRPSCLHNVVQHDWLLSLDGVDTL